MIVYVGQTRSSRLIPRLVGFGFREMVCREEWPPRRKPWALDNGAFKDWKAGRVFDAALFSRVLAKMEAAADGLASRPDFLVVPDIVAGGAASLEFSERWLPALIGRAPLYLAVQDGMTEDEVTSAIKAPYAGLFVGGTLKWKLHTGARWVALGHAHHMPVHIGRVGTTNRARWARRIGADSIDSCLPLWSETNLQRFLLGLRKGAQQEMFA